MKVTENISLKPFNTFHVDAKAARLLEIDSVSDVKEAIETYRIGEDTLFVLGGGSNVLFTKDFDGTILKVNIENREVISMTDETVTINVGAGENWHDFVMWTANNGWSGIENMAYIPGTVGAAPVQNLAAYGQTFEDVMVSAEAIELKTGELRTFMPEECDLAYRSSIFKTELVNQYLITSVTIELSTKPHFDTHYHGRFKYESLQTWMKEVKEPPYSPKDIAEAIVLQRKAKLPEVTEYGTCGSFFVNPFVTVEKFQQLSKELDELQHYPITKMEYDRIDWHDTGQDDVVKIPAGRLLDELGWRGKWIGNVGTYDKHALIIVTNGEATGQEIIDFADTMKQSVKDAYGIDLVSEVRVM